MPSSVFISKSDQIKILYRKILVIFLLQKLFLVKVQILDLILSVFSYYSLVCLFTLEVLAFQCDVISNMDIGAIAKVKNKLRKLSVKLYVVLSENVFIRTLSFSNWRFWQNVVDGIACSRSLSWFNYWRSYATTSMYLFISNNENTRTACEVSYQNTFGFLSVDFPTSIATLDKLMLIGVFQNWHTN